MKTLSLFLFLAITFLTSHKSEALIRNVPAQYTTIQAGILACSDGDTLLVQPGTYFENVNFRGKKIVVTSLFYQNNDYSYIATTIINGSMPVHPDTASCVIFNNHEDSTTVFQGFTLTGGKGTIWNDEHFAGRYREGGGILSALSAPVIRFNIITGNVCQEGGGALSTGGGGMRLGDGFPRVYNNIISNNSARYGAGVVLNYTGVEFKNNVVCKNYGAVEFGSGGGMWINNTNARSKTIENNTIVFNTALTSYAGVFGNSASMLRNNIIWGNSTTGILNQVAGSALTVRYCNVQGGYPGAGNIDSDPQFDSTNYYIKTGSGCIDKGDSSTIYNDPSDPGNPANAMWPSRGTVRNDIGAYGGALSHVIANTVVGIPGSGNHTTVPDKFYLKQNYPNPFNPSTTIEYYIPENSVVKINIYNTLGQKITALINEEQTLGLHSVNWNASGNNSGIYFYEMIIVSGNRTFTEMRKMILLK